MSVTGYKCQGFGLRSNVCSHLFFFAISWSLLLLSFALLRTMASLTLIFLVGSTVFYFKPKVKKAAARVSHRRPTHRVLYCAAFSLRETIGKFQFDHLCLCKVGLIGSRISQAKLSRL